MDRWDDGDNCGYCVTGVRKGGSMEGRREGNPLLPKPKKTPGGRPLVTFSEMVCSDSFSSIHPVPFLGEAPVTHSTK